MEQIVQIVLPVFGLIALGFGTAASGLLRRETGEALSDFVFVVAIPVLVFRTLAVADFAGATPWGLWIDYFAVFGVMWLLGALVIRRLFGRDARAGVVAGISTAYGNTVLVGIPLAIAAYGDTGAMVMALIIALHLPVMMTASAILIVGAERHDGIVHAEPGARAMLRGLVLNLVRNPLMIALALGALWHLTGVPLGGLPRVMVDRIADVASTLALFAMGMSLRNYGIRGNVRAGLVLAVLKLFLMPALVFVATRYVIPLPPVWAKVAVVAAASPTGVNAYVVAARFRTGEALASNAITISSAGAVLSMMVWLTVLELV
ncbi:MAG: AEC family transporter [Rhizobiales bacterium]|nr:AEC family transporter [Hyphomicrobiales bacterium]